jgi:putative redox protein
MDFVLILTRQRQDLRQLVIRLEGERADATPAPFERVHLQFTAYGTIEPNKLQRAAELAVRKYCSVASTLNERVELQIETQLAE